MADEAHADLVVMGVRGRNPVDLAVFGSTTQHVVRGAKCPVLVAQPDSEGPLGATVREPSLAGPRPGPA